MTLSERNQWRSDKVTKELLQFLSDYRENIKELWASSAYPQPQDEAAMRGAVGAIKDVIDMIDQVGGLNESTRQLGNEAGLH